MINGFTPIKNKYTTIDMGRPSNWDEETMGVCHSLPVAKTDEGYASWWTMTLWVRLKFLFGRQAIRFDVIGSGHPVIAFSLGRRDPK